MIVIQLTVVSIHSAPPAPVIVPESVTVPALPPI
jgi:hypothetical protein